VKRGEIYLVKHPTRREPKRQRAFVVLSRNVVIKSKFATVICAPIFTMRAGLESQVNVGIEEGLKHDSAIHCDELVSLPKTALTDYLGALSDLKIGELDAALRVALELESQ